MPNHYDVCLISLSNPLTDARTLNLASTLAKYKKVLMIALGSQSDTFIESNFEIVNIQLIPKGTSWKKWIEFFNKVKKIDFKSEYIIACDLYSLVSASKISLKQNSKLIYDSREIYSKLGSLSEYPLKQFVISQIELYYSKNINKIVVSGELDQEYLESYFKKQFEYFVIKNLPPFKEIVKSNLIRDKFDIPKDKLILIYQGVILKGRGLILILKAIQKNNNYHLVIIGDGNFKSELEHFVDLNKINDKVTFVGEVDYKDLHSYTCSADLGLCLFEPISKSYELALPNKLFEYMMAGIPCIATNLPALNDVITKNKNGILINDVYNIDEINACLDKFYHSDFRNEFASNSLNARNKYSYESQEKTILSILD